MKLPKNSKVLFRGRRHFILERDETFTDTKYIYYDVYVYSFNASRWMYSKSMGSFADYQNAYDCLVEQEAIYEYRMQNALNPKPI